MRLARVALVVAGVVSGCTAPAPLPTGTPSATNVASAEPSAPAHAALRESAAAQLGVAPDQLLLLEDGFVAARFRDDTELELVWIGPVDGALQDRVLAAVAEGRAGSNQSVVSIHAAVCPVGLGLARTRFLFGQETTVRRLHLDGLPAVGGQVNDGTYVFALSGDSFDGSTRWSVKDDQGGEVSSGDAGWLAPPAAPTGGAACTVTSEH